MPSRITYFWAKERSRPSACRRGSSSPFFHTDGDPIPNLKLRLSLSSDSRHPVAVFYFFLYFTLMSSSSSGTRLTGRRRVTIFQQFCLPCASRGFTTTGIGKFYFRVYLSHIDFFCLGCVKRIPPVQTATKSHLAFLVVGLTTSGGRMSISSSEVLLC